MGLPTTGEKDVMIGTISYVWHFILSLISVVTARIKSPPTLAAEYITNTGISLRNNKNRDQVNAVLSTPTTSATQSTGAGKVSKTDKVPTPVYIFINVSL